jgi:hypothetical protein
MSQARLVVIGLGLVAAVVGTAYELGRRGGEVAGLRAQRAVVVESLAVLDTVYLTDTLRLWRRVTAWDTLYDTTRITERITDTAWVRGTLAAADTTIRACVKTVLTCEQRVALEAKRADLAEQQLTVWTHRDRDKERVKMALSAAAGLTAGLLIRR